MGSIMHYTTSKLSWNGHGFLPIHNYPYKGWVTIVKNSELRGHPRWIHLVGGTIYVTPPLSIAEDITTCPNKKHKAGHTWSKDNCMH